MKKPRKSSIFLACLALNLAALAVLSVHAIVCSREGADLFREEKQMVEDIRLTDICLFTDARYTRNPSMADIHSSFQDSPMSMDCFPSGALIVPPPHLTRHALD